MNIHGVTTYKHRNTITVTEYTTFTSIREYVDFFTGLAKRNSGVNYIAESAHYSSVHWSQCKRCKRRGIT